MPLSNMQTNVIPSPPWRATEGSGLAGRNLLLFALTEASRHLHAISGSGKMP